MTVGGKTRGSATVASTIVRQGLLVWLSHQARGVAIINKQTVVVNANFKVSQRA